MEDSRIVDLYWIRSEQAISATAAKYGKYCFSIANNILQNQEDAKEAVNDTYLGAWKSMPPHRPQVLSSYLGKITRRIAIKMWQASRSAKRGGGEMDLALDELSGCLSAAGGPEQDMEAAELSRYLNTFVLSLPDTERRVFVCRYWYLDSVAAIADRFGFSQSKVKSMLLRTRNKLRIYLKKEGIIV